MIKIKKKRVFYAKMVHFIQSGNIAGLSCMRQSHLWDCSFQKLYKIFLFLYVFVLFLPFLRLSFTFFSHISFFSRRIALLPSHHKICTTVLEILTHFVEFSCLYLHVQISITAQKMKFSTKDFFSKCDRNLYFLCSVYCILKSCSNKVAFL